MTTVVHHHGGTVHEGIMVGEGDEMGISGAEGSSGSTVPPVVATTCTGN